MIREEGTYKAEVLSCDWTTSKKGTFGLSVKVKILDHDMEMSSTIWLTKKSLEFAKSQFSELGFDVDEQDMLEIGSTISLVGRKCNVAIKWDDYKGESKLKIGHFGSLAGSIDKNKLRKIQEEMRGSSDDIPF